MTSVRKAVLKQLSSSDPTDSAYPPYTLKQIADDLNMPISNVYRTLQDLAEHGLVIREDAKVWVHGFDNGCGCINKHYYQRDGYVYFNSATIEQDKLFREERINNVWKTFDKLFL